METSHVAKYASVHGVSFYEMLRSASATDNRYDRFFRVLMQDIGKVQQFADKPIIFATPNLPIGAQYTMRKGGFEVQLSSDIHQLMHKWLLRLKSENIKEAVVVSNNIDMRNVSVLSEYARSGIDVYIVGKMSMLYKRIDEMLSTVPHTFFVEIGDLFTRFATLPRRKDDKRAVRR